MVSKVLAVKALRHKFGPQHPCKKLGTSAGTCKPSTGEARTGRFLGLVGQLLLTIM